MVYTMKLYVDGGCRRNGYSNAIGAAAACHKTKWGKYRIWMRDLRGTVTNQRAEISAIILALEFVLNKYKNDLNEIPQMDVEILSDSKYAVNCMNEWRYKWRRNGWTNAAGYPVANQDLIRQASELDDEVRAIGFVEYTWIPRSANEVADRFCNIAMDKQEERQREMERESREEEEEEEERRRRYWDSSSDSDW